MALLHQREDRKWKKRESTADRRTGPTVPRSTVLSVEQEAIIVAFRKHTLLPLDGCLPEVEGVRELRAISPSDRKSEVDTEKLARYARLDPKILRPISYRTVAQQEALTLVRARWAHNFHDPVELRRCVRGRM